jgi:hypothetical protein
MMMMMMMMIQSNLLIESSSVECIVVHDTRTNEAPSIGGWTKSKKELFFVDLFYFAYMGLPSTSEQLAERGLSCGARGDRRCYQIKGLHLGRLVTAAFLTSFLPPTSTCRGDDGNWSLGGMRVLLLFLWFSFLGGLGLKWPLQLKGLRTTPQLRELPWW